MGKRNWSLALAIKDEERKKYQRTQSRQRHDHLLKKLQNADPEKLYSSLKYHQSRQDPNSKVIARLQEEWDFIVKNKLHIQTVASVLAREQKQTEAENKLWGQKSVYFNPELNPLGKPPTIDSKKLPNIRVPIRNKHKYDPDARIASWGIKVPEGSTPRFYKVILNTEKPGLKTDTCEKRGTKPKSDTKENWNIKSDSESGNDTADSDISDS